MMELTRRLRAFGMAEAKAGIGRTRRELLNEAADEIERLRTVLTAASHALRSYQYGNGSTDLAQSVADKCDAAMKEKNHVPG